MNLGMDAQEREKKSISIFIGLSLLFHFFLLIFIYLLPSPIIPSAQNTVFIDLSALPPPPDLAKEKAAEKMKQIVQSDMAENDKNSDTAKYLGERNQTVAEETKAKQVDMYHQGSQSARSGGKGQALSLKDLSPTKPLAPPTNKEIEGFKKEQEKLTQSESGDGKPKGEIAEGSANNDYLKNVKDGDKTMLSTKEFIYYGYYNRIRKKLEIAWNSKLRATLGIYGPHGRQLASDRDYVTGLIVVLDRNGKVTGVQMLERSGAHDLDQAAVDAFNDAGPFPDPPSGLIDTNGEIKIRWDFIIQS